MGGDGASEKMIPYASSMQHSPLSMSDEKCGLQITHCQPIVAAAAEVEAALQQGLCEGTGMWVTNQPWR